MARTSRSSLSSCLRSRSWQTTLMVPRPVSLWVSASIAVMLLPARVIASVSRASIPCWSSTSISSDTW